MPSPRTLQGLRPPLKGTAEASRLFESLDADADGAVDAAEAGYLLALLCAGGVRARVDAACESPGAPAAERLVTLDQALEQVKSHQSHTLMFAHVSHAPSFPCIYPVSLYISPTLLLAAHAVCERARPVCAAGRMHAQRAPGGGRAARRPGEGD